jgi:hypothetical protein
VRQREEWATSEEEGGVGYREGWTVSEQEDDVG